MVPASIDLDPQGWIPEDVNCVHEVDTVFAEVALALRLVLLERLDRPIHHGIHSSITEYTLFTYSCPCGEERRRRFAAARRDRYHRLERVAKRRRPP